MNRHATALSISALAVALAAGCASNNKAASQEESQPVTLAQLSAPARAAAQRETAGGRIDKISKETEHGKLVYDVEATVRGKHVEYTIADSDGAVLGRESAIELGELPPAVRSAAESYFDKDSTLSAVRGVEYGETTYEVVGMKNGKKTEMTWDAMGKPEKPEK